MKLSDFIAKTLSQEGIDAVFGVTGGAVVHLFDSAEKYGIQCVFTHHEQAAAFAAQAYARIKGFGAGFFTTGPGGTNAVTGIAAAWLDSVPVIYFGGQVRTSHIKPKSLRQQGAQELDIVSILSPITKYATIVKDPIHIRYELEKCIDIARSGRPGPVYMELPLEIQWAEINDTELPPFSEKKAISLKTTDQEIKAVIAALRQAKKPLLLIGHGVRLGHAEKELHAFLNLVKIPYVTTWNATDLVDGDDLLNLGRPGMFGCRSANLSLQAADFVCCLGSHLPVPLTTGDYTNFAKNAQVAVINIDAEELKHQRANVKYSLHCDVKIFLEHALSDLKEFFVDPKWQQKCTFLHQNYLHEEVKKEQASVIDAYEAVSVLNTLLQTDDTVIVDGGGTIVQIAFQTLKMKLGQRLLIDAGLCSMGSGLPQSLGAAFAQKNGRVLCLCGDGSFQFNIHELQTLYHHRLPVKIFIFNNEGYLSIRHTQQGFLNKRFIGSSSQGGLSLPNLLSVAQAYQIPTLHISNPKELASGFHRILQMDGPAVCEIKISPTQEIRPKIGFDEKEQGRFVARPIEDMHPYLPEKTLEAILN